MSLLDPQKIADLILFNLEAKLRVEIIEPASEAEAIGLFLTSPHWDIVLIDGDQEWKDLTEFLKNKEFPTAFVVMCSDGKKPIWDSGHLRVIETVPKTKFLERFPILYQEFFEGVHFGEEDTEVSKTPLDHLHCRIRTRLLLQVSPLKADIYIRLSGTKFIKLFLKGDVFDKGDLEKYLTKKKIHFLYLLKETVGEFMTKLEKQLQDILDSKTVSVADTLYAAQNGVEVIQEMSKKIGFTPEVQKIVRTTSKLMVNLASKSPRLSAQLANFEENKDKYIAGHSIALGQVACAISAEMGWTSEPTYQKLTMAAMLHDISLENQTLATVQTLEELEQRQNEFTVEELQEFKNHPMQASNIVKSILEIPPDVDTIVIQHHELPNELGFPHKLPSARISPLASLFIVAHELVGEVFGNSKGFSVQTFIENTKKKYTTGNFKKVIAALEKAAAKL